MKAVPQKSLLTALTLLVAFTAEDVTADDIRIVNANIITMDEENPIASTMLISGNRIVAVGNGALGEGSGQGVVTTIDAKGAVVIPGIIDQHLHWSRSAITWGYALHAGENVFSKQGLLEAIAARAADPEVPSGAWITLIGRHNYLQFDGGYPTRAELDAVSDDHPVLLLQMWLPTPAGSDFGDFNQTSSPGPGQMNTLARDFFNGLDSPVPPLSAIPTDGSLTTGRAGTNQSVYDWTRANNPLEDQIRSTLDLQRWSHSVGLVGIGEAAGGDFRQPQDYQALTEVDVRGDLKMRIRYRIGPRDAPGTSRQSSIQRLANTLSAAPLAETRSCVGPAEISGQGFYLSRVGSPFFRSMGLGEGIAERTPSSISEAVIYMLRRHDWSFQLHAEAEQIPNIIQGLEDALAVTDPCAIGASFADRHNSLDHLNDASDAHFERLAAIGAGAGIQAIRFLFPGWEFSGPPYRAAIDAQNELGLHVGCGADGMFAANGNPWTTMQFMVTGEAFDGTQLLKDDPFARAFPGSRAPDQTIELMEGLQCYTKGSAWFSREEHERGQLKAGFLADVVILDQNPFEVEERRIRDTKAALTIVDGEIVYDDQSLTRLNNDDED